MGEIMDLNKCRIRIRLRKVTIGVMGLLLCVCIFTKIGAERRYYNLPYPEVFGSRR